MENRMADAGLEELLPREIATVERKRDPYPWFKEMREQNPVRYDEERDTYDVFTFDAVAEVAADWQTFGREGTTYIDGAWQSREPPIHTDMRRMADSYFRENYLAEEFQADIQGHVERLVDEALANGPEFDFVEEIAKPLPRLVIADVLGIRSEQIEDFLEWSEILVEPSAMSTAQEDIDETVSNRERAVEELLDLFSEEIEYREDNPQNDVMTAFLKAEEEFERLTRKNTLACCAILLAAGNHSTTVFATNSMWTFAEENVVGDLQSGDLSYENALEEALRYRSPVTVVKRATTEPTELAGTELPEGARVYGWLPSANRDGNVFGNPDQFDPQQEYGEQPIAFGKGIHYCLGAPLARLEARTLFEEFFDRIDTVEVTEETLPPNEAFIVHGPSALPIRVST